MTKQRKNKRTNAISCIAGPDFLTESTSDHKVMTRSDPSGVISFIQVMARNTITRRQKSTNMNTNTK